MRATVYLGAIKKGSYIRALTVTQRSSIILHPGFDLNIIRDDIGLIKLPEDAPIANPNVGVLSLPYGSDVTKKLEGLTATVSGFGRISDSVSSNILKYIRLPIVPNLTCSAIYTSGTVTAASVCLGSVDGKSTCHG